MRNILLFLRLIYLILKNNKKILKTSLKRNINHGSIFLQDIQFLFLIRKNLR